MNASYTASKLAAAHALHLTLVGLAVLLQLWFCPSSNAFQDSLAKPTSLHTEHILPAPWQSGAISLRVDYLGKMNTARLRSLTVRVGKDTIRVPEHILSFFPAPKPGSFELYSGPILPNRTYCVVRFRFFSWPDYGLYVQADPCTRDAWIVIENGKINHLTKIEQTSKTVTTFTDYDPKTLKQTRQTLMTEHPYKKTPLFSFKKGKLPTPRSIFMRP